MRCVINLRCSNKIIASPGTKRKLFFNFSQNPIRSHKIFTVLLVAIAIDSFFSSFYHQENPKQPSYISLWNALLRMNHKITNARGRCYDNASTMSKKKSSITTQIKCPYGKCVHSHCHGQNLNLDVGHVIKNEQSLCDVFDIMREMM